jgi:hypothetical protein
MGTSPCIYCERLEALDRPRRGKARRCSLCSPWPTMQRFDFIVRNKPLTGKQAEAIASRTIDDSDTGAVLRQTLSRSLE